MLPSGSEWGDAAKSLVSINIPLNPGLAGTIPDLSSLTELRTIYLNSNNFTGPLPESLGKLRSNLLRSIDLSSNDLQGTIPATWSHLENLETLLLSHNSLTGLIPEWVGESKTLTRIDLENNPCIKPLKEQAQSVQTLCHTTVTCTFPASPPRCAVTLNNLCHADAYKNHTACLLCIIQHEEAIAGAPCNTTQQTTFCESGLPTPADPCTKTPIPPSPPSND